MSAAIVALSVGIVVTSASAILWKRRAKQQADFAIDCSRGEYEQRKAKEALSAENRKHRSLALRAVALLRDDAHRSRQTKDGTRRYDAWRADRDALIREVEG